MPTFNLKINNKSHTVEADRDTPLLWILRDHLNLLGTKFGCGIAQGIGLRSAVEGIARNPEGRLLPEQLALC